jgi:SET domain-containing protein
MKSYLPRSAIHPKVVAGRSRINGTGVFARDAIAKGERVMVFGGEVLTREQALSGDYRIRSIRPVDENTFLGLPESDPDIGLDEYLNHSCDANTWLEDEVTLVAKRDIAAGEEITLDQGTWNIEDPYISDLAPCSCGAPDCRGELTEKDWKRADVQERYRGHFHPMIRRL